MKNLTTKTECPFEAQVLEAVAQYRWPERVEPELRTHVPGCAVCSDLAAVAVAIGEVRDEARPDVPMPDAGRVWWLAQLRAKREAAKTAGRPITVAQVLAFACAMGLSGACFGATSTWFQETMRRFSGSLVALDFASLIAGHALLAIGIAAAFLAVPAVVYFAVGRD